TVASPREPGVGVCISVRSASTTSVSAGEERWVAAATLLRLGAGVPDRARPTAQTAVMRPPRARASQMAAMSARRGVAGGGETIRRLYTRAHACPIRAEVPACPPVSETALIW